MTRQGFPYRFGKQPGLCNAQGGKYAIAFPQGIENTQDKHSEVRVLETA